VFLPYVLDLLSIKINNDIICYIIVLYHYLLLLIISQFFDSFDKNSETIQNAVSLLINIRRHSPHQDYVFYYFSLYL